MHANRNEFFAAKRTKRVEDVRNDIRLLSKTGDSETETKNW